MDPHAQTALITAIAISISNCNSIKDTARLASLFSQLGDTLARLAAQRTLAENDAKDAAEEVAAEDEETELEELAIDTDIALSEQIRAVD